MVIQLRTLTGLLLALFAGQAVAQAQTATPNAALSVHVPVPATTGASTEVELHNLTDKTITCYQVWLTVTLAGGKQIKTAWTEDLLGTEAMLAAFPGSYVAGDNGGMLGPGHTRIKTLRSLDGVPPGETPVKIDGVATGIIFDDRTAIGDPTCIKQEFAARRDKAAEDAALIAEVEPILADKEIHAGVARQKAMAAISNVPEEKQYEEKLKARVDALNKGTAEEKGRAEQLYSRFGYGPLVYVQGGLDLLKVQQAAWAAGAQEANK